MKIMILITLVLALPVTAPAQATARMPKSAPVKIIFDTDIGNDVDDVLAL